MEKQRIVHQIITMTINFITITYKICLNYLMINVSNIVQIAMIKTIHLFYIQIIIYVLIHVI